MNAGCKIKMDDSAKVKLKHLHRLLVAGCSIAKLNIHLNSVFPRDVFCSLLMKNFERASHNLRVFLQAEGRGGAEEAAGGEGEAGESCAAGRGGASKAGGGEEEQGGRGETTEGAEVEGHAGSAGQRGDFLFVLLIYDTSNQRFLPSAEG